MVQSATAPLSFAAPIPLPVQVDFTGGRLTSDGGLPWLAEADTALGLCAALAAVIPDWRTRRGRHDLPTLLRQRIYQIACGYEDQNDATQLRSDPLLKLVCGRLPETDPDLASQPTLSRLETSVSARTCYRLAQALGQIYLAERERDGPPTHVVLDLDGTDDPTHGDQEGTAYHGYFGQYMYHPVLIFDGATEHLVTAVLRPGTVHASFGVVAVLRRVVGAIRDRWPTVTIEVRADAGFAVPALYDFCETEGITYTLGLGRNSRLSRLAAPLRATAVQAQTATGVAKVRLLGETRYQAKSWLTDRRVVIKVELLPKGPNTRFVVTTRLDPPTDLYAWYTKRGETENWIKDLKAGCFANRLSCHRFWANQFRLLLHAAAYWLLSTLRRWLVRLGAARMELSSLRLTLIKLGGRVEQQTTRVQVHLTSHHPGEPLWHRLAPRLRCFVNNPG
jgi:hypothetical protein